MLPFNLKIINEAQRDNLRQFEEVEEMEEELASLKEKLIFKSIDFDNFIENLKSNREAIAYGKDIDLQVFREEKMKRKISILQEKLLGLHFMFVEKAKSYEKIKAMMIESNKVLANTPAFKDVYSHLYQRNLEYDKL